ncbi:hypothetical protein HZY97_01625 [Sphingomonas sp. R-74633]|uniref:hypothetical protein n=1 Tax=Sphingomonas sp. R-74633 TaxID=2751188 RepID=UPI0015D2C233|nr:hypothetical protein [Sphingomonas sp. R-74633]NYT39443.1 hypothetical protein [Sphingomonas sp. R-74633]
MITASLIPEESWNDIPEDNREAFLFLAQIARTRLTEVLQGDDAARGPYTTKSWQRQYVWELTAIADELGIPGLPTAATAQQTTETLAEFDAQLARILTSIKIALRGSLRTESVTLSYTTKETIRSQIEELRSSVNRSNLSDSAKVSLHKKLDAVEAQLDQKRAGLRPFWILAGAIGTLPQITSFLADAPGAKKTIDSMMETVQIERKIEAEQEFRLCNPPALTHEPIKQITDQSSPTV